jgi:superfamily I DNA and RNA helicase
MQFVIALNARGVRARVAGQGGRRDELFGTDAAVPIANVLRAKGSESAMVYVVQAEHAADRREVVKRRNALFTAVTRSRAWVRISGSGPDMAVVEEEVRQVVAHGHRLELEVPSERDMARIRRLQRDMTRRERRLVARGRAGIAALADLAREDDTLVDTAVDSLSAEERDALRALLRRLETDGGK